MGEFKKIDFLTPIQKNLINLCKTKTFAWLQYLHNENKITINFFKKDEVYINYDSILKNVLLESLDIDNKKINYYRLILKTNPQCLVSKPNNSAEPLLFVYKILIDYNQIKNSDQEFNNYKITHKNVYYYPNVITFFEKKKIEEVDNYLINRIIIDPKCLFKMEFEIKKIVLITDKKYKKMLLNVNSEYNNQVLYKNKISLNDITYFFFYHPDLMPLNQIYGFEYHTTNYANLKDIDILLKIKK